MALPERVLLGIEKGHGEHLRRLVMPHQGWHRVGQDLRHPLEPGIFEMITLDGRPPVGSDAKGGEGPLDAEPAALGLDEPDVGGDAAGERIGAVRLGAEPEPLHEAAHSFGKRRGRSAGFDRSLGGHRALDIGKVRRSRPGPRASGPRRPGTACRRSRPRNPRRYAGADCTSPTAPCSAPSRS